MVKADRLSVDQILEPLKKRCEARNGLIRARNDFKKRMAAGKEKGEDVQEDGILHTHCVSIALNILSVR